MSLEVEVFESKDGKQMVFVRGRLDTNTAPNLEEELKPVLESKPPVLVLDLSGLEYISSAGLRTIFRSRKAVHEGGGKMFLVNIQPQVQKVFDIIKAIPDASVFRSVEELDQYLDSIQRQ